MNTGNPNFGGDDISSMKKNLSIAYVELFQQHIPGILFDTVERHLENLYKLYAQIAAMDLEGKDELMKDIVGEIDRLQSLSGRNYYEMLTALGYNLVQTIPKLAIRPVNFPVWIRIEFQELFAKMLLVHTTALKEVKSMNRKLRKSNRGALGNTTKQYPVVSEAPLKAHTNGNISYILNLAHVIEKRTLDSAGLSMSNQEIAKLKKIILQSGEGIDETISQIPSRRLREIVGRMVSYVLLEEGK